MQCPVCEHENAEGKRFCSECGAQVVAEERQTEALQETAAPNPFANDKRILLGYSQPVTVRSAAQSHCGKKKPNQEDRIRRVYLPYPLRGIEVQALILTDGIGGRPRGEFFAEAAANEIATGIHRIMPDSDYQKDHSVTEVWEHVNLQLEQYLKGVVMKANVTVFNAVQAFELPLQECGTTLAMIVSVIHTGSGLIKAYAWNGGDAQCGVIVDDELTILSHEHTVFGGPSQFLGKHADFVGSNKRWQICLPETNASRVSFYVASDGVRNHITDAQLVNWCQTSKSPRQICSTAIKQSLTGPSAHERLQPGHDNATIGVVSITKKENSNGSSCAA